MKSLKESSIIHNPSPLPEARRTKLFSRRVTPNNMRGTHFNRLTTYVGAKYTPPDEDRDVVQEDVLPTTIHLPRDDRSIDICDVITIMQQGFDNCNREIQGLLDSQVECKWVSID